MEGIETNLRKQINSNFVIRYIDSRVSKKTNLIGGGMLHKLIDLELAERLCIEALDSGKQVYTRKLRRGLTIKFHSK